MSPAGGNEGNYTSATFGGVTPTEIREQLDRILLSQGLNGRMFAFNSCEEFFKNRTPKFKGAKLCRLYQPQLQRQYQPKEDRNNPPQRKRQRRPP
jgi:hypothetical protein